MSFIKGFADELSKGIVEQRKQTQTQQGSMQQMLGKQVAEGKIQQAAPGQADFTVGQPQQQGFMGGLKQMLGAGGMPEQRYSRVPEPAEIEYITDREGNVVGTRPKDSVFQQAPQKEVLSPEQEIEMAAKKTAVVASEKERQLNLSKVRRLGTLANSIETEWFKTQPEEGGMGRLKGLGSIGMSVFQASEQQRVDSAYRKFVKGMRAQLARSMGDVGNLSEPEQVAAMELVPTLGDARETGKLKLQAIRSFIQALETDNTDMARNIIGQATNQIMQQPLEVDSVELVED